MASADDHLSSSACQQPVNTCQQPANTKRVLSVDVGTTSVKCDIYDNEANIIASSAEQITLIHPHPGWVELEPLELWSKVVLAIKTVIQVARISPSDVTCMGIATFRGSFITWDKETGEHFHNISMWQDMRTKDDVERWNNSFTLGALNKASYVLHGITRQQRFKAGYALKFMTNTVPLRLKWMIDNIPKLRDRLEARKVRFGTLDTWLLWKLTGQRVWLTDHSCASCTLLYDPYQNIWSSMVLKLVGIPDHIFPDIAETIGDLGHCDPSLFGADIPITALVGDQQSAMFGHCCFNAGDVKCTLGTGTFMHVNIGDKPLASITGIYPVVGWKLKGEFTYLAEAASRSTGTCVEWLKTVGILSDIKESSALAESVSDSKGVYFVPAFSGLPPPINDDRACGLLIGLSHSSSREHIIRAVLESFAFLVMIQYETMVKECGKTLGHVRVDGGVACNDFLMQTIADLLNRKIHRPMKTNLTSLGAAYLAGLGGGVWKSLDELRSLEGVDKVFTPRDNWSEYRERVAEWERAVRRSKEWYHD